MSLKTSAISEISEFTAFNSYQNPVTNVATITLSSISESNYSQKVNYLLGSVVMEQNGYSGEGTNTLKLNFNDKTAGIYFVLLQQGETVKQLKLIRK